MLNQPGLGRDSHWLYRRLRMVYGKSWNGRRKKTAEQGLVPVGGGERSILNKKKKFSCKSSIKIHFYQELADDISKRWGSLIKFYFELGTEKLSFRIENIFECYTTLHSNFQRKK